MADEQYQAFTEAFRPRARILQLLGEQLIGSPRLAVFELVKNAYDADAERVTVTLEGLDSEEPSIIIQDDGLGMSLETVRDIWMVPAHDHKQLQRTARIRTQKGRLPLGEKGVGRFAVHKLGNYIELVTKAQGQLECVVEINWSDLIDKPMLSDATVLLRTRAPEVFTSDNTGTRIVVKNLHEKTWRRGEVRKLNRQITSISSPFSARSDKFVPALIVQDHPEWLKDLPDVHDLVDRALWTFVFSLDEGVFEWNYLFKGISALGIEGRNASSQGVPLLLPPEREIDESGKLVARDLKKASKKTVSKEYMAGIGPIIGTLHVFDRDREVLALQGDNQIIQAFLDENGGVRVYRDGIRVYNYGEDGDDWLGLDLRRVNSPTRNISRNIVLGAVDLSLEQSTDLNEKTNREGFVENDAYKRFRKVISGAISVLEIERKRDKDRIRAVTRKAADPGRVRIIEPLEKLRKLAKRNHLEAEVEPLIRVIEQDMEEMRDTMLRAGLSGLGLAVVFHEVERGVRVLSDAIEKKADPAVVGVQARELVRVLDGFSELLRKGEKKKVSLKHILRRVRDINLVRFRFHGVKLLAPALEDGHADVEVFASAGLILGALNNIIDNAFYWLDVKWPSADESRLIYMSISSDNENEVAVTIADNGPGFQDAPDLVTHPFFSRRPEGMGLGLYYANLVMQMSGGRLEFPSSSDAGLPDEFNGAVISLVFPVKRSEP